ncbi:MAG: hypothetical protein HYV19_06185 [Gemmatimonadetes bacterium]|nr:hypothetical protein [Gemmatimonadota bacterium]
MRPSRSSIAAPFLNAPDLDDASLREREVEALRVEYRRLMGRINYRTRRGWMFLGFLLFTLLVFVGVAVFVLSPSDWLGSQQSRFAQMTSLLILTAAAMTLGGYFARRYDRQRERVRIARTRKQEVLARLSQLDEAGSGGRRLRRRRRKSSWAWRIAHPSPFNRPALETMDGAELADAAEALGGQLSEERAMRALAYAHAGITGAIALVIAFAVTLSGPQYLSDFLGGRQWGGGAGVDPLVFWLMLTIALVVLGGLGSHRVTVLLRHARAYHDRLRSVERALWDARVLLRQRREEV